MPLRVEPFPQSPQRSSLATTGDTPLGNGDKPPERPNRTPAKRAPTPGNRARCPANHSRPPGKPAPTPRTHDSPPGSRDASSGSEAARREKPTRVWEPARDLGLRNLCLGKPTPPRGDSSRSLGTSTSAWGSVTEVRDVTARGCRSANRWREQIPDRGTDVGTMNQDAQPGRRRFACADGSDGSQWNPALKCLRTANGMLGLEGTLALHAWRRVTRSTQLPGEPFPFPSLLCLN